MYFFPRTCACETESGSWSEKWQNARNDTDPHSKDRVFLSHHPRSLHIFVNTCPAANGDKGRGEALFTTRIDWSIPAALRPPLGPERLETRISSRFTGVTMNVVPDIIDIAMYHITSRLKMEKLLTVITNKVGVALTQRETPIRYQQVSQSTPMDGHSDILLATLPGWLHGPGGKHKSSSE